MPPTLEADVALIHLAGGGARVTPPAGTLALTAPRRAARGRSEDFLFISLGLQSAQPLAPGLVDHLAHLASGAYFATPGSVTAAMRQAAEAVNDHLLDLNQADEGVSRVQGRMMLGVLRVRDLYLAQSGVGQAIVIRPGQVNRLVSEEAAARPLGLAAAPLQRFHHLEAQPGDLVILTTAAPPIWADTILNGLLDHDLADGVERLATGSTHDLTGLLMRMTLAGERRPAAARASAAMPATAVTRAARPSSPRAPRGSARPAMPIGLSRRLNQASRWIQAGLASIGNGLIQLLGRMAPGLVEPGRPGSFSPSLLAGTAIAVPVLIVIIASLVYFRRGRGEQFQTYVSAAQAAVVSAQLQPNPAGARPYWDQAKQMLDLASGYGSSSDADSLRQSVQQALDSIDLINHAEYRPVLSGGFGSGAHLTGLAATTSDLYVLDSAQQTIWHAWATGRGYEIDSDFKCLKGKGSVKAIGEPVSIAVQGEPGALGAEGVVAIDSGGSLLYCAPGRQPATGQLTPPDTGWGQIKAIAVSNNKLYVLDPKANAVWTYDAAGGLFSGSPALYFAESVPSLRGAISLAMTQEELFVLYDTGKLTRCRRTTETAQDGSSHIRVDCEKDLSFQDERPGGQANDHIPGAQPIALVYGSPPEPSLYFLDRLTGGVYHYSMRLVYQGLYLPQQPLRGEVSAIALGPPNDLFVAAGGQVYYVQPKQ